jgi:hypothetical protein
LFDFNGDNQQTLVASSADFNGQFNSDYSLLFTIAPSLGTAGKQALVQTNMVVAR